jgi:tetratricopeptide (TPR) repeat protein
MSKFVCDCTSFSVKKTILSSGEWGERPLPLLAQCKISVSHVKCSEKLEQPSAFLTVLVGENHQGSSVVDIATGDAECDVDHALERALCTMLVGERSFFSLESPDITLQCHIHLLQLNNPAPLPDWPSSLALEVSSRYKQRGVDLFQQGRTVDAFRHFSKAVTVLVITETEDIPLYAVLCSNMAACQLQKGNHVYAASLCDNALNRQPSNAKALYRRAVAAMHLNDHEKAEKDVKAVLALEPKNPQATKLMAQIKSETREANAVYEDMIRRMFSK